MKELILNEKAYVENVIASGKIYKKPGRTIALMANYYYQVCGYRKKIITELLIDFLQKNYPPYKYKKSSWNEFCEKIAKRTGGENLLELKGIGITQKELDTISAVRNKKQEQLLFTMLCIAKLNNERKSTNDNWINTDLIDIFKMAKVPNRSAEDRDLQMHRLCKSGLIEIPQRNDNTNIRVTFVDDFGDTKLFITDLRELGLEYLSYLKPSDYFRCVKCKRLTKKNSSGRKGLCYECANPKDKNLKTLTCVDCGKQFKVDARVSNKCRCDSCQIQRNRELQRERRHSEASAL